MSESVNEWESEWVNEWEWMSESDSEWVNEWESEIEWGRESETEWVRKWVNEWHWHWESEWVTLTLREWMSERVNEWKWQWEIESERERERVSEWVSERMNEWESEWVREWMSERVWIEIEWVNTGNGHPLAIRLASQLELNVTAAVRCPSQSCPTRSRYSPAMCSARARTPTCSSCCTGARPPARSRSTSASTRGSDGSTLREEPKICSSLRCVNDDDQWSTYLEFSFLLL